LGKSVTARYVASSWGGAPERPLGFCESPRKTPNGVEHAWRRHNDCLLAFDDTKAIGANLKARADWLTEVLFMLEQGTTKERMTENSLPFHGRVVFLLTSNESLREIFSGAGAELDESYRVRLLELPVMGETDLFETIPKGMTPKEFWEFIDRAVQTRYGAPSARYLRCLTQELTRSKKDIIRVLGDLVQGFLDEVGAESLSATAQRAAKYFGLVFAAGALACLWGILPIEINALLEAAIYAFDLHRKFVEGDHAKKDPVARLARYIRENRHKFEDARANLLHLSDRDFRRARGIRHRSKAEARLFSFSPTRFRRILGDEATVFRTARLLRARNMLVADRNLLQTKVQLRASGSRDRVYCIRARILDG
jgi:hypothetical protein